MEFKYKDVKKIDIKKWLLSGNTKIYFFILVLVLAAIIFVLKTVGDMDNSTGDNTGNNISNNNQNTESTEYFTAATEQEESTVEPDPDYYESSQKYKIKINKSNNFLTVYKLDDAKQYSIVEKQFKCSVNPNTELGKTAITFKYTWVQFGYGKHGQYVSKLKNGSYIHSVPYYTKNMYHLNKSAYNLLGQASDVAYIYLQVADVKWIFENCGVNTVVDIYEDESEISPFAGEQVEPITTNYDPSDTIAVERLKQ